MSKNYAIALDHLRDGKREKIKDELDPSFLQIEEEELKFLSPVIVEGEAYLADTDLVIHLRAETIAKLPCAICNQMIDAGVKLDDFYHAQPLEEIKEPAFDYRNVLRDDLLIELPKYVECNGGKCPDRAILKPFLKKEENTDKTHFPFAGLDKE